MEIGQRQTKADIKTFEGLEVWKVCRELRLAIFKVTESFPAEERYRLVDQLRRAVISSTANIAEGYGRFHYQENIQFCRQSRGSLYEILDHLTTALDHYCPNVIQINSIAYGHQSQFLGNRCSKVAVKVEFSPRS